MIKLFVVSVLGIGVLFIMLLVPFVQKIQKGEILLPTIPYPSQSLDPHVDLIRVTRPDPNAVVTSPLTVEGDARGRWYFEASFPVILTDDQGNEVGHIPAHALGDWMTNDFVPFRAELEFTAPASANGWLILKKDNPSGLSEQEDKIKIPIRFH